MNIVERIDALERCLDAGLDAFGLSEILNIMGASGFPKELIPEIRSCGEYLPRAEELGFNPEQRFLHFLWECLDLLPIGLIPDFSYPFRRMIAERLFKRCGGNFIAERNVQFNFGHNIEVGDDVFLGRGVYLDSKGGIEIGNSSGLADNVVILTHSHSESVHHARKYAKVTVGEFVKVCGNSMIMPGVSIGNQAIVAPLSLVTADVPPNTLVGGVPARPLRERENEGRNKDELSHIWLRDGAFQLPF